MRWKTLILLGIFLISFVNASIPDDCESSIVSYWQMENNLNDAIGNHDTGTWGGTSDYDIFKVGEAAHFIGDGKIEIPADDITFSSSFTIEMQIKSSDSSNASLLKKGVYEIEWNKINTTSGLVVATIDAISISSANLDPTTSHNIALTWGSATGELILYIDGVNKNQTTILSAGNAGGDLIIGDKFDGLIDEVAIYNAALPSNTIELHYALTDNGKDYCDESGAGGSSTITRDFSIGGCTFEFEDETIGIAAGECSRGDASGYFYCDKDKYGWVTQEEGYGCSLGETTYTAGEDFCCPEGMFCNETENGFRCDRRTENCFNQTTISECEEIGCIWLEKENICADGIRDYACGYYKTEEECNTDELNLGKAGVGTELCGTYATCNEKDFAIPYEKCQCEWYPSAPEGQNCQVKLVGSQIFYDPLVGQDIFECSNTYKLGKCNDRVQEVEWFSNNSIISGFDEFSGVVPEDCLEALGCNNGATTRI
ncbi:MAG: LamG domain-containing protein, partial [Nanoarchaeota archaeon]|nr:LamG domain-containing protein [Nanoarchaeota archaeon]